MKPRLCRDSKWHNAVYCIQPDGLAHWMTNEENAALNTYAQEIANEMHDLQRVKVRFKEAVVRQAREEVKRLLRAASKRGPGVIDEEWERKEFMALLHAAMGEEQQLHMFGTDLVKVAEVLDVEVPEEVREKEEEEEEEPYVLSNLSQSPGERRIDAKLSRIMEHLNIPDDSSGE